MKSLVPAIFLVMILLISCDCLVDVGGKVVDSKTNKPIKDAKVELVYADWGTTITDEDGCFSNGGRTNGIFWCSALQIEIYKDGYESKVVKIRHNIPKTIKLKPIRE